MEDYPGNSNKEKEVKKRPVKKVKKVVTNEVVTKKKPFGSRFKDIFIGADAKTSLRFIGYDVLLPALKNMIVEATSRGIERMIYGDGGGRRPPPFSNGPKITYNQPVNRFPGPRSSPFMPQRQQPRYGPQNQDSVDLIFATRDEADIVLEMMVNIVDEYQVVSLADLRELAGVPSSYVDNSWGWTNLGSAAVRQVREGYIIDFPTVESI